MKKRQKGGEKRIAEGREGKTEVKVKILHKRKREG